MIPDASDTWIKSSHSGASNTCLEILTPPPHGRAVIRDSVHNPHQVIWFDPTAWQTFSGAITGDTPRHG